MPLHSLRVRDEALTVIARVFGVVAGIVSSAITARTLGPEDRGSYFFVITVATILTQFGHLGVSSANTFFVARYPRCAGLLLQWSIRLSLVSGIGLALIFMVLSESSALADTMNSKGLPWLILLSPAMLLLLLASALLAGLQAFSSLNGIQIAYQMILVCAFGLVALYKPSIDSFLGASALGACVAAIAYSGAVYFHRSNQAPARADEVETSNWFKYGMRAYLILLAGALVPRIGIFFVKAEASAEELGYYSIAIQIFDALVLFPSAIATILFPSIAKDKAPTWLGCLRECYRMGFFASVLAIIAAVALPFAVKLVFGSEYAQSAVIAQALLPGFVALSVVTIASQYLAAKYFPRPTYWNWFVSLAVLLAACAILVPNYGALGVAIALSVSYSILAILMVNLARQLLEPS